MTLTLGCAPGTSDEAPVFETAATPAAPPERLFLLDSDGLYEVFETSRELFAAAPEGSTLFDAAVSRDGSDVAFAVQAELKPSSQGFDFGIDLYVSRDGAEPVPVVLHERLGEAVSRPNWLPGGDSIVYGVLGREDGGATDFRIERFDLATGTRTRLIEDAVEPALSPGGESLVYLQYDEIGARTLYIYDFATGESRPLLPPNQIMSNVANFAWSPDGSRIAFAASDPIWLRMPSGAGPRGTTFFHPTLRDPWIVNVDGSDLRRVTELADASLSLAWSHDNRHLYGIGDTGFWRIDTQDGALELLGPGNHAGRVQTLFP